MRLISGTLVALGIVLPFLGLGRPALLLGALCVAAGGLLAARQAKRRGWLLGAGGIVAAALLLLAPGVVRGVHNRQGIAWAAPEGERVVLAEHGLAVTARDESTVLTGRDLATGKQRWRLDLGDPRDATHQLSVQRVGRMLLVVDRDGQLVGVDAVTGKRRWDAPATGSTVPAITDGERVAINRCDTDGCRVETRSAIDGSVRWQTPVSEDGGFLGAPVHQRGDLEDLPLWPAGAAVVRRPPKGARYEVRALATGRVVAHGTTEHTGVAVIGDVFLAASEQGAITATDIGTGRRLWARPADGLIPVRSADRTLRTLALPEGKALLVRGLHELPTAGLGSTLRLLDPRTGKVTEHPIRLQTAPIDVTTTDGPAPGPPILDGIDDDGDTIQADDRLYRFQPRAGSIAATASQVGWSRDVPGFGSDDRDGAEVYARRSGRRLVRYAGDDVRVRSVGERLVIVDHAADEGGGRQYVVAP